MREIKLSDEELLLLDGKVSPDAQKIINWVKTINQYADIGDRTYAEIIALAAAKGALRCNSRELNSCPCGKSREYRTLTRGRNRGKKDFDHPIRFYGVSFMDGFVTVQGHSNFGYCHECGEKAIQTIAQYIQNHDLKIEIPGESKWIKEEKGVCKSCGKDMWQFDMMLSPTWQRDGYYYSDCPHCGAEGGLFSAHGSTNEFRMVEASGLKRVKNCWQRRKT